MVNSHDILYGEFSRNEAPTYNYYSHIDLTRFNGMQSNGVYRVILEQIDLDNFLMHEKLHDLYGVSVNPGGTELAFRNKGYYLSLQRKHRIEFTAFLPDDKHRLNDKMFTIMDYIPLEDRTIYNKQRIYANSRSRSISTSLPAQIMERSFSSAEIENINMSKTEEDCPVIISEAYHVLNEYDNLQEDEQHYVNNYLDTPVENKYE